MSTLQALDEIREFLTVFTGRIARIEGNAIMAGLEVHITPPEIRIIEKIGPDGSEKMGSIARALGITLATLTVACDKLEKKGLIERRRDPQDKRTVRISLTASGLVAYHYHDVFQRELIGVMLDGLSQAEQQALLHGIRNLTQYLIQISDGQKE